MAPPGAVLLVGLFLENVQCRAGLEPLDLLRIEGMTQRDPVFAAVLVMEDRRHRLARSQVAEIDDADPVGLLDLVVDESIPLSVKLTDRSM